MPILVSSLPSTLLRNFCFRNNAKASCGPSGDVLGRCSHLHLHGKGRAQVLGAADPSLALPQLSSSMDRVGVVCVVQGREAQTQKSLEDLHHPCESEPGMKGHW